MMQVDALDLLRDKLGEPHMREEGIEYDFECPMSNCPSSRKGKKKLGVNFMKRVYFCFVCKAKGTLADLFDRLEIHVFEQDLFQNRFNRKIEEPPPFPTMIPEFIPLTEAGNGIAPSLVKRDIFDYVHRRSNLLPFEIVDRGWGFSTLHGLMGRLIIPIKVDGQLVQYLARSIYDWISPKEKCGPVSQGWWPKGEVAYDLSEIRSHKDLVLVEGIWDREAVLKIGHHALALLGSSISQPIIGKILRKRPERIVLLLDSDEPGRLATRKIASLLLARRANPWVAVLPPGVDPDECPPENLARIIDQALPAGQWLAREAGQLEMFDQLER